MTQDEEGSCSYCSVSSWGDSPDWGLGMELATHRIHQHSMERYTGRDNETYFVIRMEATENEHSILTQADHLEGIRIG